MEAIVLKIGDPCPACGGAFVAARALTAEEHRHAFDKENPQAVSRNVDTMPPDQIADHGALYVCGRCAYQTRFQGRL